jgi:hypothetical protein
MQCLASRATTSTAIATHYMGKNLFSVLDVGSSFNAARNFSSPASTKPPTSSLPWRQIATFAVAGVVGFGTVYIMRDYVLTDSEQSAIEQETSAGGPGTCNWLETSPEYRVLLFVNLTNVFEYFHCEKSSPTGSNYIKGIFRH